MQITHLSRAASKLLLSLVILPFLMTGISATVINVPADKTTIQAGIDSAGTGDTVLVAPGYYLENISFRGKEILVSSHFLLDRDPVHIFNTTIDGSNSPDPDTASTVVIFSTGDLHPVFQGFTVIGGGGTVMLDPTEGEYKRNGGGIATRLGSPTICFNYIHHNQPNFSPNVAGGGLYMQLGNPTVENNIIMNNPGRTGCGISIRASNVIANNNVIAYNSGGITFGGAGIYLYGGQLHGNNNTVAFNHSSKAGGGLRVAAAGIYMENSIVWGNTSTYGAAQTYIDVDYGGVIDLQYSDVEGGYPGTGNIDADPLFAGSWLFTGEGSPCIDAGDPDAAFSDLFWPSAPTAAKWPSRGGLRNDMGAYGGPICYPFELAQIYTDDTLGWIPWEAEFAAESNFDAESWSWNFGDGDTATGPSVVHTYDEPGLYDVSLTIGYNAGETYEYIRPALIWAVADTMSAGNVTFAPQGMITPVEVLIYATNSAPLDDILIPIAYSGDLQLSYASFTTAGCRTADMDSQVELARDPVAKTVLIELSGSPSLPPGSGPILKLLFNAAFAADGQTATIALTSGLLAEEPLFGSGAFGNQPVTFDGSVVCNCCAGNVGDADLSGMVDITDISVLVDNQFLTLTPLVCEAECNINYPGSSYGTTDLVVDVTDLSILIDNQFGSLAPLPPCP